LTTKGVASVSSNVGNLSDYNDDVSHETFVDAVVKEFKSHYGGDGIVQVRLILSPSIVSHPTPLQKIDEKELETNEYASSVVSELKVRPHLPLSDRTPALTGSNSPGIGCTVRHPSSHTKYLSSLAVSYVPSPPPPPILFPTDDLAYPRHSPSDPATLSSPPSPSLPPQESNGSPPGLNSNKPRN
jgi:hypothetical protein